MELTIGPVKVANLRYIKQEKTVYKVKVTIAEEINDSQGIEADDSEKILCQFEKLPRLF